MPKVFKSITFVKYQQMSYDYNFKVDSFEFKANQSNARQLDTVLNLLTVSVHKMLLPLESQVVMAEITVFRDEGGHSILDKTTQPSQTKIQGRIVHRGNYIFMLFICMYVYEHCFDFLKNVLIESIDYVASNVISGCQPTNTFWRFPLLAENCVI